MQGRRLLCTADLHIGRTSAVAHGQDGIDFTAMGAWKRMVDVAIQEKAAAVVIAGDIFDGRAGALQSRRKFCDESRRLREVGIPVVAVAGNHDHDALRACFKAFPEEGLVLLGDQGWEARSVKTNQGDIRFLGWSFRSNEHRNSPFGEQMPMRSDEPTVGILHADTAPQSRYAPILTAELRRHEVPWIIGHVHKPTDLFPAGMPACYPGSPQALDFGETGEHGFRWLTLDSDRLWLAPLEALSNIRYEYAVIDVFCDPGENVDAAYEEAVDRRAKAILRGMPEGSYLCLRVRAQCQFPRSRGSLAVIGNPSAFDGYEAELIDCCHVPDLQAVCEYALHTDALGQASRILLGLLPDTELNGCVVQEAWVKRADDLVNETLRDFGRCLDRLVRPLDTVLLEGADSCSDVEPAIHVRASLLSEARALVDILASQGSGGTR